MSTSADASLSRLFDTHSSGRSGSPCVAGLDEAREVGEQRHITLAQRPRAAALPIDKPIPLAQPEVLVWKGDYRFRSKQKTPAAAGNGSTHVVSADRCIHCFALSGGTLPSNRVTGFGEGDVQ
ncbi:hypothetical protein ACFSOZ_17420 [Mesorhizobium newzealandense]|uniref:Uncharacterized protein n=2 Tax=Mesorhizobium TaxID=68287 RepID=A0ABW4UCX3_9HYPH